MNPLFLNSASDLRKWFLKNHNKKSELYLGLQKKDFGKKILSQAEAVDQALCFGWTISVIKRIDALTYCIKMVPRRKKGAWSQGTMKRFRELQREGLAHASGISSFTGRDKKKSEKKNVEFAPWQLKLFKANKKAWTFFSAQTPSYQKYMKIWVTGAMKKETQEKRLQMLVDDSAQNSKLKRIVEANEKIRKRSVKEDASIEDLISLNEGLISGLRNLGIENLEQMKIVGWEKIFYRLCELDPVHCRWSTLSNLIGVIENQDPRSLDVDLKAEGQAVLKDMKR